jgi:hypothetical protein
MLATVSQSRSDDRPDPGLERGRRPPASRQPAARAVSELAAVTARRAPGVQAQLEIGRSEDPLEHEADRVAERLTAAPAGGLRRACACGGTPGPEGECAACKARRLGVQRKAARGGPPHAPTIVHEVLNSPGRPLEPAARSTMERGFGRDFAAVRVHTDARAAASARAVDAHAYTVGSDVVFAEGRHAPETVEGRLLLAHELAHVVQQGAARTRWLARKPAPEPQAFGPACSEGAADPCQMTRCSNSEVRTALADLDRGLDYVRRATGAARESPLADSTVRALDWYFNDHSETTAREVASRLDCIGECLTDTSVNGRFGCHPDYDAIAYVCAGQTPVCSQVFKKVCLTSAHFKSGGPERAHTTVHECAHRVGMSLGAPSLPDIYRFKARFGFLDTFEALLNSDSFAGFALAITKGGIPVSRWGPSVGLTAGSAFARGAKEGTWYARLQLAGLEVQHPVLGIFNPTVGFGMSFIGESTSAGPAPVTAGPTLLYSVVAGVRIAEPRPGAAGAAYVSLWRSGARARHGRRDPGGAGRRGRHGNRLPLALARRGGRRRLHLGPDPGGRDGARLDRGGHHHDLVPRPALAGRESSALRM